MCWPQNWVSKPSGRESKNNCVSVTKVKAVVKKTLEAERNNKAEEAGGGGSNLSGRGR